MQAQAMSQGTDYHSTGNKNLEINSSHELIKELSALKDKDMAFAGTVVEQIYDNALIQAGLIVDPRNMVERSYEILRRAVKQ